MQITAQQLVDAIALAAAEGAEPDAPSVVNAYNGLDQVQVNGEVDFERAAEILNAILKTAYRP